MRFQWKNLRSLFVVLLYIRSFLSGNVSCNDDKSEYSRISCKDEKNEDVDWFINYKIPKVQEEPKGSDLHEGLGYAYIIAPGSPKWTLSNKNILKGSMIERTLDLFYKDHKDLTYLFYNDDLPGKKKKKSSPGHLKGVLVFDDKTGFWLIHSIPNFPDDKKYDYPESSQKYGQTALCITFKTSQLNEIANQLLFSNPNIYASGITADVEEKLDNKSKTLFTKSPAFIKKKPFLREAELKSLGNKKFISFSKDNQLQEDLYSDIIAPALETSLMVETWRKGNGGYQSKKCGIKSTVVDIDSINMEFETRSGVKNISFKYTQDHSKWAISDEEKNHYVCIADLNRMESQEKRGGGAICFDSSNVVKAFDSIIEASDKCGKS